MFDSAPVPDAVVHLAAIAHRTSASITARDYDQVNHRGLLHVLEAAARVGVKRFVFFSSASVYGEIGRTGPVSEDTVPAPVGPYAQSKLAAEQRCVEAVGGGMERVILRFPAIYSREWLLDVRKRAYIPLLSGRALLHVPGRQPEYSLCAIEHVLEAVTFAVQGGVPSGVYNVSDGAPYQQAEVASVIGGMDGVHRRVSVPRALVRWPVYGISALAPSKVRVALRTNYWKLFNGLVLDTSRLEAKGFRPRVRLDHILRPATTTDP